MMGTSVDDGIVKDQEMDAESWSAEALVSRTKTG
jgi:hypothetical protein